MNSRLLAAMQYGKEEKNQHNPQKNTQKTNEQPAQPATQNCTTPTEHPSADGHQGALTAKPTDRGDTVATQDVQHPKSRDVPAVQSQATAKPEPTVT